MTLAQAQSKHLGMPGLIATIPRSGTNLLSYFLRFCEYFASGADVADRDAAYTFVLEERGTYDFPHFGLKDACVTHAYCPGHREAFQNHPSAATLQTLPESKDWFDVGRSWVRKNSQKICRPNKPWFITFVYRNPLDFIVSMTRHAKHHRSGIGDGLEMASFIDRVMPAYARSYLSYVETDKKWNCQILMMPYEKMMRDRANQTHRILEQFELEWTDIRRKAFDLALEHTSIESMKALESFAGTTLAHDQRSVPGNSHIRNGLRSLWRETLKPEEVEQARTVLARYTIDLDSFYPEDERPLVQAS